MAFIRGPLFYRSQELLVVTKGISETNAPKHSWPSDGNDETIEAYFERHGHDAPERYGTSLVKQVFDLSESVDYEVH